MQGSSEEREEFARQLRIFTNEEELREEERRATEIENDPSLKAQKEKMRRR